MRPACAEVGGLSGTVSIPENEESAEAGVGRSWLCRWGECSARLQSPRALDAHLRAHSTGRGTHCLWRGCGKRFESRNNFRAHLSSHGEHRPFLCPYEGCPGAFKQRRNLKIHLQSHAEVKPYFCPQEGCNKGFRHSQSLNLHLRIHSGDYPFPCLYPDCSRRFNKKSALVVHVRLHTGETPFPCSWPRCDRAFKQKTALLHHLMLHRGEKTAACILSGRDSACIRQYALRRRKRAGAEKRQLTCTHEGCNKQFVLKTTLTAHRKVHREEKLFVCPASDCLSRFRHKQHLRKHLDTHIEAELEFPCSQEGCREVFCSRRAVAAHSRVHKRAGTALSQPPDVTAAPVLAGTDAAVMEAAGAPLSRPAALSCAPGAAATPCPPNGLPEERRSGLAAVVPCSSRLLPSQWDLSEAGQQESGVTCGALQSLPSEAFFPRLGELYPAYREWWGSLPGPASDRVLPEPLPPVAATTDPGGLFQPHWHRWDQGAWRSPMMPAEPEPLLPTTAIQGALWQPLPYQNRSQAWPQPATLAVAGPGAVVGRSPDSGGLFPPQWSWQEERQQWSRAGCVMPGALPASAGFSVGESWQPAAGARISCPSSSEVAPGGDAGWLPPDPLWCEASRESAAGQLAGPPRVTGVCEGDALACTSTAVRERPAGHYR